MTTHSEAQVPGSELVFRATRAGGPGGQHVNTSSTRVELWWDVSASPSISDDQRARVIAKLGNRIDSTGQLRLVSSGSRSQLQNRREVTERFHRLIAQALVVPRKRKKTRPSKAAKERRLQSKRIQGHKKELRRKPAED
jgi:ribosome-associated protein